MANASNTLHFLSQAFDIAPSGTQEEGIAAQNLANVFHEHGLESAITTFAYSAIAKYLPSACAILIALFGIIAGCSRGVLPIVMLVLILLVGAVYVLDRLGIATVTRFGPRAASQNVVARHPAVIGAGGKGARPVVIIAHYDTPRADILSMPLIARFKPYIAAAVDICLIAIPVCVLLEALPVPDVLHSILWAIALVAGIILIAWGVCGLVSMFVLQETEGANDNKSSVAALLGVLDRVRPVRGGVSYDDLLAESAAADAGRTARGADQPVREQYVEEPAEKKPVRRPLEVIRSLGVVPADCEIVYEDEEPRKAQAAAASEAAPASDQVFHLASAGNAVDASQVLGGETQFIPRDQIAAAAQIPAVLLGATQAGSQAMRPVDPEVQKDQVTDAIMANIVAANALSGMSPSMSAASADATVAVPPAIYAEPAVTPAPVSPSASASISASRPIEVGEPLPDGATMLMQPVGGSGLQLPDWAPPKKQAFQVITELDETDAELRHATSTLPPDITGQATTQATSSFSAIEPSDQAAAMVSADDWGTSSFSPVNANRLILGEDLPDPAVAAIDPYSVTSIETTGEYNSDDFSQFDFETGTHDAVTPAMLEEVQRRNLDGFTADFTEKGGKRSKRGRGRKTGRISHQAAQMQAEMEEQSFTDWMGLDEDFDAKKNGRQIGSWDNFESSDGSAPSGNGNPYNRWQGGATRRTRRLSVEEIEAAEQQRQARQAAMTLGDRELVAHEVWFVLTGAGHAGHAGAADFFDKYRNELRGAYIINLECVGAGVQSLILEEGATRRTKADRRLVNLFGEASTAINRPLSLDRMTWRDTDATAALLQNCRAVTVCGLESSVPANAQWTSDVVEALNPAQIDDLVDIIVEVIKNA